MQEASPSLPPAVSPDSKSEIRSSDLSLSPLDLRETNPHKNPYIHTKIGTNVSIYNKMQAP